MEGNASLIWLVLFLPLIGSALQALFGKRIVSALGPATGKKVLGALAITAIAIPFGIGLMLTMQMAGMEPEKRHAITVLFDWIRIASLHVPFELVIDPLSMTMVLIITGIGSLIHLYATGYMSEEKDYARFFTYLNLFVASMLILVLGNNLALMFIGWEGVGLCSYLLIGFWYKDVANAKAANKAFIVNRIGDWGLTLGMFMLAMLLVTNVQTEDRRLFSYDFIFEYAPQILANNPAVTTTIALLLFVGACGKSAQFPLYFWLPDAMAGPTPVSALIHAATMVTAGVFMINRMNIVFQLSPVAGAVIAAVGAFTALFAALIAFGQTDIKKVLAYSTVSQLGFMFIGCGVGAYWTGMFHVTTHAFFKALLFLGSGAVIHAMAHNQDMRNYGNLKKYLPITFFTMMIGYVAIAGIPFFAGFYSKESILGAALAGHHAEINHQNVGAWAGWLGLVVAALTAMYMTRMTWMTFFGKEERWRLIEPQHHDDHAHDEHHEHAHAHAHGPDVHNFFYSDEEMAAMPHEHEHHHDLDKTHEPKEVPPSMWLPLAVLAVASAFGGWLLNNNHLFEKWLYPHHLSVLGEVHTHPEGINLMALSLIAAIGGCLAAWIYYSVVRGNKLPTIEGWDMAKWSWFRRSAVNQFGYDETVVSAGVEGGGALANFLWKRIDVGIVDTIVNGVGLAAQNVGRVFRVFQSGYVRSYALMMLAGAAVLIGLLYATTQSKAPSMDGDQPSRTFQQEVPLEEGTH